MGNWIDLLSSPIIIVIALALGTLGEVAKRVVKADEASTGWRRAYYITLPAHPVLMGLAIGLFPWLPIPDGLVKEGFEAAGRLFTGILGGVVCKVGYDGIVATAKRLLGQPAGAVAARVAPKSPAPSPGTGEDEEP